MFVFALIAGIYLISHFTFIAVQHTDVLSQIQMLSERYPVNKPPRYSYYVWFSIVMMQEGHVALLLIKLHPNP